MKGFRVIQLDLPPAVSSPQDLQILVLELRQYAEWLRDSEIKQRYSTAQQLPVPQVSEAGVQLLRQAPRGATAELTVEGLVTLLETCQATAPSLTITLAAPASAGLKRTLTAWCREHVSPQALVDFRFNGTLLGGMVVHCGSHIYDWSFRRQILANRHVFPEVLRHV